MADGWAEAAVPVPAPALVPAADGPVAVKKIPIAKMHKESRFWAMPKTCFLVVLLSGYVCFRLGFCFPGGERFILNIVDQHEHKICA